MNDWAGVIFIFSLIVGAILGLRFLGLHSESSEEEFERRAAEGTSLITAGVEAINGLLNPSHARGKEAVIELKKGSFNRRRQEGKGQGNTRVEK